MAQKSPYRKACLAIVAFFVLQALLPSEASAQSRKPTRSKPPEFKPGQFDGIFFTDVRSMLKGELPGKQAMLAQASPDSGGESPAESAGGSDDPMAWSKLIAPESIDDLVKGAKLRLDRIVTTPAAFQGGGFVAARREFSMLALLFAVIETYPNEDIRFRKSAPIARELLARVAANSKVGSRQTYNEAKQRLLDLGDLVNGSQLAGEAKTEIDWSNLIDRVPLMNLLAWAHQEKVAKLSASEAEFKANKGELKQYAQLIAVLGKAAIAEDMPDATDEDYLAFIRMMVEQSSQVALAVDTDNPGLARSASGQIGQSCQDCHDNFR